MVVRTSAPDKVFSLPLYSRLAHNPTGPGLTRQEPSANLSTRSALADVAGGGLDHLSHQRGLRPPAGLNGGQGCISLLPHHDVHPGEQRPEPFPHLIHETQAAHHALMT